MSAKDTWEYDLMPLASNRPYSEVQQTLNATGNNGWELIAVYPTPEHNVFVFKKRTSHIH